MFCTCSRICSISTFMSTAARVVSMSWDFDDSVLASRFSSCIRKSSRRPAGSWPSKVLRTSVDVAAQPIDLFVDVQPLRQNREFLFEPILIDVADQLCDALEQLGAHARADLRQPVRRRVPRTPASPRSAAPMHRAGGRPRCRASARVRQGFGEQAVRGGDHGRGIARAVADDAGPAQQVEDIDARRGAGLCRDLLRPRGEAGQQFGIDFERGRDAPRA